MGLNESGRGMNHLRAATLRGFATGSADGFRGARSLGVLGAVLVALGLAAGPAMATTGHNYTGQFGGAGNAVGTFNGGPTGLVVRQSTGDVFASDPGHTLPDGTPAPRIERFDAGGIYQDSINLDAITYGGPGALAIDPAGATSLYIGASNNLDGTGAVLKYAATGALTYALVPNAGTAFTNPAAVAVDPTTGTVYVSAADTTTGAPQIERFSNTGTFVASYDGSAGAAPDGAFGAVSSLAVDAAGRLYVLDGSRAKVYRYSGAGAYQLTLDSVSPVTVTADPISSEVYVVEAPPAGQQVTRFTAGGAATANSFGTTRITAASAVGVESSTGTVYTADPATAFVERFTSFAGPTVATTPAASVDPNTETLNGTINPNSSAATFHFEYGLDRNYGAATAETSAGSGAAAVLATDVAPGLTPNTQYHFRVVGSNATGTITGGDQTFTTAAAAPVTEDAPANANPISSTGATLNATINPNGSATTTHFEYGTTTAYGSVTPDDSASAGAGQGDIGVSAAVTALTPGTTYHFRVVASNGTGGDINGADQTFSTAPAADGGATNVTGVAATLTGVVNPHGVAGTYHFEYGTTTAYGTTTLETSAGSGSADTAVTVGVTGLQPATTYHVHVVATVNGAIVNGDDGTLTTDPAPTTTTGQATDVGVSTATLSGAFDTHGLAGSFRFLVSSTTNPYSSRTAPASVDGASGSRSAAGTLTDLVPGETYLVRLAVTAGGVTTLGDEVTFSTPALPPVAPPAPPDISANPYGCGAPVLAAYNRHPEPGDAIAIVGADLGVAGTVALGAHTVTPNSWSPTGFTVTVPDDATGTLPLTINCGTVSNTIAIAIFQEPSNVFTAKVKVKGHTATVTVTVPGPGTVSVRGTRVKSASRHASAAGSITVKATLSTTAVKLLRRHHRLATTVTVRFTPTGGHAAAKTVTPTFKESK
jgi:hypothetical protein